MKYFLLVAATLVLFFGCKDDDNSVDQAAIDDKIITDYLAEHNLTETVTKDSLTGIYYSIDRPGFSGHPTSGSTVEVTYTGYFTNDSIFEKTKPGLTSSFNLSGSIITGWKIAIPLLQRNGSGTFYMPSRWCYGNIGSYTNEYDTITKKTYKDYTILPNTALIFKINLVDFY